MSLKDLSTILLKTAALIFIIFYTLKFIDHYIMPTFITPTPISSMLKRLEPSYKFKDFSTFHKDLQNKYVQLKPDQETVEFLKGCNVIETRPLAYFGQKLVYNYLRPFVTLTSLHALLDRGGMFVLSSEMYRKMLDFDEKEENFKKFKNIADLGAGDGNVSKRVARALNLSHKSIKVTDVSPTMKYRLKEKGFTVVDENNWHKSASENEIYLESFDAIFMLNLLDRCEKPYSMLELAHKTLNKDHGRLIVSLVFPIRQSIEWRKNRKPDESIYIDKKLPLERQISLFLREVMAPSGFSLIKFSKVPYLSEGDIKNPFYELVNIVMVFESVEVDFKKK